MTATTYDPKGDWIAMLVSAPMMIAGLVSVAMSGASGVQFAGAALVIGGAVAIATGDWLVRFAAWSIACVAVILAVVG